MFNTECLITARKLSGCRGPTEGHMCPQCDPLKKKSVFIRILICLSPESRTANKITNSQQYHKHIMSQCEHLLLEERLPQTCTSSLLCSPSPHRGSRESTPLGALSDLLLQLLSACGAQTPYVERCSHLEESQAYIDHIQQSQHSHDTPIK